MWTRQNSGGPSPVCCHRNNTGLGLRLSILSMGRCSEKPHDGGVDVSLSCVTYCPPITSVCTKCFILPSRRRIYSTRSFAQYNRVLKFKLWKTTGKATDVISS